MVSCGLHQRTVVGGHRGRAVLAVNLVHVGLEQSRAHAARRAGTRAALGLRARGRGGAGRGRRLSGGRRRSGSRSRGRGLLGKGTGNGDSKKSKGGAKLHHSNNRRVLVRWENKGGGSGFSISGRLPLGRFWSDMGHQTIHILLNPFPLHIDICGRHVYRPMGERAPLAGLMHPLHLRYGQDRRVVSISRRSCRHDWPEHCIELRHSALG